MRCWMNQGTTMCFNNIEKDIEYCCKYGFESIELKYNLICNFDMVWIKDLLQSSNVRAGSIGAIQLPIMQGKEVKIKAEEKLNIICECANVLQSEFIVVIPPRGMESEDWHIIEEDAVRILEKYSSIAAGYHVKLAMEVMGFSDAYINTIERGLKIVEQVGKNNLGIIYDFYHVLGMRDLEQVILRTVSENIFIVHVNDGIKCSIGKYQDNNRLWPGDGDVDIVKQIGMLKSIGYNGPFSMEVYQPQPWNCDMQECYRIAQRRMKKIGRLYPCS